MAVRYYLATGAQNIEAHGALVAQLRKRFGGELALTYDWPKNGAAEHLPVERKREIAQLELNGVQQADILIVLWPGLLGTHVEMGAALAKGKPVFLYAPEEIDIFCIFHTLPLVSVVKSEDELFSKIAQWITEKGSKI